MSTESDTNESCPQEPYFMFFNFSAALNKTKFQKMRKNLIFNNEKLNFDNKTILFYKCLKYSYLMKATWSTSNYTRATILYKCTGTI